MKRAARLFLQGVDRFLSKLISGAKPWMSHALLGPATLWLVIFLALPLAFILMISFAQLGAYGSIVWQFTLSNYARALTPVYFPVLVRSLLYAGATTILSILIGYPIAYYLSFFAGTRRGLLLLILMVPFWTSSLVVIYSCIILLGREGLLNNALIGIGLIEDPIQFLNTPAAVILGLTYFYLPLMVLPLYACLEKLPRTYVEAAKDLGAGDWDAFRKITLPLSMPGIWAGSILTFIPCAGDFLTPDFLGNPQTYLIGNLIENQFLAAQDWPYGAALAALLVALFLSGLYVYLKVESSSGVDAPIRA